MARSSRGSCRASAEWRHFVAQSDDAGAHDPGGHTAMAADRAVAARPQRLLHSRTGRTGSGDVQHRISDPNFPVAQGQKVDSGHEDVAPHVLRRHRPPTEKTADRGEMLFLHERHRPLVARPVVAFEAPVLHKAAFHRQKRRPPPGPQTDPDHPAGLRCPANERFQVLHGVLLRQSRRAPATRTSGSAITTAPATRVAWSLNARRLPIRATLASTAGNGKSSAFPRRRPAHARTGHAPAILRPAKRAGSTAIPPIGRRTSPAPDCPRPTPPLSRRRSFRRCDMAAYQYVYHMDGLSKTYPGGKKCFENIRLSFLPGVKIGVVGVNGAGKSTLLRIMAGIDKDFSGEAWAAQGARVGYLPQEPELDESLSVRGNVMEGVAAKKAKLDKYNELAMNYSDETAEEMAALQDEIDAQNLWDLDSQIDVAMEALRCPPDDASVDSLSGGERRRVALCKLLLEAPEMLLLDEPTNHLDAETIAWLQKHLIEYKGTILIVTHDRYFLDDITGWILELDRGRGIPYEGNYSAWLEQKAKRLEREAKDDKSRSKTLERELEWIRSGAKARQAKSKARINAYEEMAGQSERERVGKAQIVIPNGPRLGTKVIEVENLSKGYGDRLLVDDLSFALPPGGIVGVIGPNGAGKSTLFRMLTGQETPDEGTVEFGDTVQLSYVDQSRDALDGARTVWEEISGGAEIIALGDATMNSRAYCSAFNFKGGDQQKKVGLLSGGERNRVHMAKLLKSGGNVLLLDEPTNDLDVETLRALEDALEDFAGCAVIISHDRFFLDRLCTHILAFEGDAHVEWFEGNFEAYEEDKIRRLGPDSVEPKRVKHKKFAR